MGKESETCFIIPQVEYYTLPGRHELLTDTRDLDAIERRILLHVQDNILVVGYEGIRQQESGNHAVGVIGRDESAATSYCVAARHSIGPATRIYHPRSGALLLPYRALENASKIVQPDTTLIQVTDQAMLGPRGIPIGPFMPREPCWMTKIMHTEDDGFLISMALRGARMTERWGVDKHDIWCPLVSCSQSEIGLGSSGSPVFQMIRGDVHLVASLHGLSVEEKIMVSPTVPILQSIPGNFVG